MQCGQWDSLVESVVNSARVARKIATQKPEKFQDISHNEKMRITTSNSELDSGLGGGIVPGSLVLLAGDPGIGKSTLVLQTASEVAKSHKVLYASGEESAGQVKLRGNRMKDLHMGFDFISTTDIDEVIALSLDGGYDLVIVDSIQTMTSQELSGSGGTTSQITNNTLSLIHI